MSLAWVQNTNHMQDNLKSQYIVNGGLVSWLIA